MKLYHPVAAALAAILAPAASAGWEDNLPDPIPASSLDDKPYKYVGRLSRGCSGTVTKYDRVILTAAHCFYDDDGVFGGVGSWWPRLHASSAPDTDDAIPLYGHRRYNGYVSYLQGSGGRADKEAFNHDIATAFGFQDLAFGSHAAYYTDGATALKSHKDKRIVGYPTSLYSEHGSSPRPLPANADKQFKMHSTSAVGHRFFKRTGTDHFYRANGRAKWDAKLVTSPGNSGGPVYVKDSNGVWGVAGVFVSVIRDYKIGVDGDGDDRHSGRAGARALNGNAISELIDPLASAGDCNYSISPLARNHAHTGGTGSITVNCGAGCPWGVSSNRPWVTFDDEGDGFGNDTVTYNVAPNPGADIRTAAISLGGKSFFVHQLGHATRELHDRTPAQHSLSHPERAPGQSLTIRADVSNTGNSPSGGFSVRFYASTNATISASDYYLGQKNIPSVAGGSFRAIDRTVTIPDDIPGGTLYIGWIIDAGNAVSEQDETNNRVVHANTLFVRRIDLKDRTTSAHKLSKNEVHGGETLKIEGDVRNEGNASSGVFKVMYFASRFETGGGLVFQNPGVTNPVIEPEDVYLGMKTMGSIPKNGFANLDKTVTIPASLPAGRYKIKWAIDAQGQVAETDEGNNVVLSSAPSFRMLKTIDLRDRGQAYQSLSHTTRKPGQSLTVRADVRNTGNTGAGAFKVRFYASEDAVITSSDTLLGEKSVVGLGSGDHVAIDRTVQLPHSMAGGFYRIGWKIDPEGTSTFQGGNVVVLPGQPVPEPPVEITWNNTVLHPSSLKVETPGFVFDPGSDPDSPRPGGPGGFAPNPEPPVEPGLEVVILDIQRTPGTFAVEFATRKGFRYTLQESPDTENWENVASVSGTGSPETLEDGDAEEGRCFYRVRAVRELVFVSPN